MILKYTVTSNHIHLLILDGKERDGIPNSMKLIAGRTGQEFNQRKSRKGAFWEDRYHATAVESGDHLFQCLVYIDLHPVKCRKATLPLAGFHWVNMVRAGVVDHPSEWPFCGYNEIQKPRRKNILIDYERLRKLLGFETYEGVITYHRRWVEDYLGNGNNIRDEKWTRSIAVGSRGFVDKVKSMLGALALGRKSIEAGESYQLREPSVPYNDHFEVKKSDIGSENTYLWNVNI